MTRFTASLAPIQVTYGLAGDTVDRTTVFVGDVTGRFSIPLLRAGRKPREETYSLDVVFWSLIPGGAVCDAEDDLFSNLQALDDYLADDPSAGGVVLRATLGDFTLRSGNTSKGAYAELQFQVDVLNRLA